MKFKRFVALKQFLKNKWWKMKWNTSSFGSGGAVKLGSNSNSIAASTLPLACLRACWFSRTLWKPMMRRVSICSRIAVSGTLVSPTIIHSSSDSSIFSRNGTNPGFATGRLNDRVANGHSRFYKIARLCDLTFFFVFTFAVNG